MESEKIEWRRAVTLIMLTNKREIFEIEETIRILEPIVFSE